MEGAITAAASGGKAPKPFLRRGEGVEKRVFASRYKKAITPPPAASTANSSSAGGSNDAWGASTNEAVASRRGSQQDPNSASMQPRPPPADAWSSWDGKSTELASETQLVGVEQPPDQHLDTGPIGGRFLRNSLKAAWASRQAEEELELEEFRALETQIKADVVGGARPPRYDQGAQALPSSSTLLPSVPVRSYAAIHQHRPPQPGHGAPRGGGQTRPQATWASSPPSGRHRYNDATGEIDADAGDGDEYSGGLGYPAASDPHAGDDVEATAASAWGQQQPSPGKAIAAAGGRAKGGAGLGGAPGAAAWGLDDTDGGGPVSAESVAGRGFDDAAAWNDTSSFGGNGAGASVRKGAAAAAANTNSGRSAVRGSAFFGGHSRSPGAARPLDDPWAAPAGGDDAYGAGLEAQLDDCSGWSADQQQKLQQPQAQAHRGADGDRGPDQPFVRALFNKQQQQRQPPVPGGGRAPGKGGASGAGGKGRAAEPQGPSAAELERMQALEEQMSNVASERSTLVRMRTELEKAANRLEQERQAWEKSRAEEQTKWEAQRDAEEAKLRRDRRVLEKQSKALLKLPNKKERTAMEAAEAALEAERREGRAREARHKLTVERLRRQLVELQERNHELREEVRWHEAQQLERGWGGPGAAAAGGGGTSSKGAPTYAQTQPKPRPSRVAAVQTDPLPFLPPLEGGAGASTSAVAEAPDAPAGTAAACGGPQRASGRDGAAAAPSISGGRPKSAGLSVTAGGSSSSAGRLRRLQAAGRGAAAGLGASQPSLPTTWRAERAVLRKSSGAERWQASAWGQEGDNGPEEGNGDVNGDEAGPSYYGQGSLYSQWQQQQELRQQPRQQRSGPQPDSPVSSQQGRQQAYDMDWEYDDELPEDEELAEGAEELEADGTTRHGNGRVGDGGSGHAYSRGGGGGGAPGIPSPSSYSYVQNDDAEVLTDEGGGAEGMDSESLSAMAWQQHQEFMARMSLGQGDGRHVPQAGPGGPSQGQAAAAAADLRQPGQRQPHPQQQPWGRPAGAPNEEGYGTHRPGTSGRVHQQQQPQHQEGPACAHADARSWRQGSAPVVGALKQGPAPVWNAYPDQEAAAGPGPGAGQHPGPGWGSAAAGPGAKGTTDAFFAAGGRAFPGPKPGDPTVVTAFSTSASAAGQTSASTAQGLGPGRPLVGLRDSVADLDRVSQTLASLRMDRHVEAAAAAVASTRAGGGGAGVAPTAFPPAPSSARAAPVASDPAVAQRGGAPQWPGALAAAQEREDGGWSPPAWAPAGSVRPKHASGGPAWGPAPPQAPVESGGWGSSAGAPPGQPQYFQQQQQQQIARPPALDLQGQGQHWQRGAGYGAPQWPNPVIGATTAGAASVAQSIPAQQQHPHGAQSRPAGPQPASVVRGSDGGNGKGGDVMVREVRHADGKTERIYASGTRLVLFANGTRKVALPDGSSRVYFANGDIKWSIPAAAAASPHHYAGLSHPPPPPPPEVGVVHYYYAEVGTWHSTYGGEGGVEVFYFPSGQTEAHHPGHGKEILFPDGVLRVVTVDGEEVDVSWQQLSWAVQQPQPRVDDLGDDEL